jgi:hypothetical protein
VPRLLPFFLRRLSPVLQMRAGESSGWLAMKLSQPFANELSLQRRSGDYNRRGKCDSICLCLSQIWHSAQPDGKEDKCRHVVALVTVNLADDKSCPGPRVVPRRCKTVSG